MQMTALSSARGRTAVLGAVIASVALALAGCASNSDTASKSSASGGGGGGSAANTPAATVAATGGGEGKSGLNEPDTNKDGKVVIGILSPGDINDHGYYESFVDEAQAYADKQGWKIIKRGSVPASDALTAARALCQQKVDMVALGASELKDAIPAAAEPVCKGTAWYVPASANLNPTPHIVVSSDDPTVDAVASGYGTGLLMKGKNLTKAGFVSGLKADFSIAFAKGFLAGIKEVVPNASLIQTYTGDFNDSAKAKEAVQAQLSQGAKVIYPYLGGATDAAAKLANSAGALTLTPGTDRCDSASPKFDVSVIFSPGDFFLAALESFSKDELKMGVTRVWKMGVDPYPTVKLCHATAEQNAQMADFIKKIGSGEIKAADVVAKHGG
jgi:basic membrane protein A